MPLSPNEKSSSRFSSKRCFCASVSTEYARRLVSAALISGYPDSADKWPCTRTCGGEFVVKCRSDPPASVIFFRSSGSVSCGDSVLLGCSKLILGLDFQADRYSQNEKGPADLGKSG